MPPHLSGSNLTAGCINDCGLLWTKVDKGITEGPRLRERAGKREEKAPGHTEAAHRPHGDSPFLQLFRAPSVACAAQLAGLHLEATDEELKSRLQSSLDFSS